jgi:hypothetical protein
MHFAFLLAQSDLSFRSLTPIYGKTKMTSREKLVKCALVRQCQGSNYLLKDLWQIVDSMQCRISVVDFN